MLWRKLLLWFASGFLLLILVAAIWLWTADLGVFKPQIEQWVSDKTGRQFSIVGDFDVRLGEQTTVVANAVQFANASWAAEPQMLEVGYFELRIDTLSLLKGPIQIDLIRLSDARFRLQRSSTEDPNWALLPGAADENPEEVAAGSGVLVKQIDIERAQLVYESPERTGPIELHIEQVQQRHDANDFLEISLRGGIDNRSVELHAKVGTWEALLAQKDVEYELDAQIDTFHLISQGRIDDLLEPRRPAFTFSASAPDVNDLARLLRIEAEYVGDIDFSGSLSAEDGDPLTLFIEGNLGLLQARATGSFSDLQSLDQADLELAVSGPDLSRVLRLFGINGLQPAPFMLELDAERMGPELVVNKGHMIFAEAEFDLAARIPNFPSLDDGSIHFAIAGADFERFRIVTGLPGAAKGPYSLAFDLKQSPGGVEVLQLDIESTFVKAKAQGELRDVPDYLGTELSFELDITNIADIGSAYSVASLPDRPVTANGTVVLLAEGIRTRGPIGIRSNEIVAELDGLIALQPGIAGSDVAVSLRGPDLAELLGFFAISDAVPAQPYSLDGKVKIGRDSYRLQEIRGKVARSTFGVDGLIKTGTGLAGTALSIESAGPALEELTGGFGDSKLRPGPYSMSADLALTNDLLKVESLVFERERGRLDSDLELTLPVSKREANFRVQARGDDLRALIGTISDFEVAQSPFDIDVRGDLRETRLSLDTFDATVGDALVKASGNLDIGESMRSTRFSLDIVIPDVAKLGLWEGRRLRGQSFSLGAQVRGGGGSLEIDTLTAKLGDSEIHGSVFLETGTTPQLTIEIRSDSVQLAPLMEPDELEYEPVPKFDDGRLIPDLAIPFETMTSLNASVNVEIGELRRNDVRIADLKLQSELRDGVLNLGQFDFRAASGWLRAKGSLDPDKGAGKMAFQLAARDFAIGASANADLSARADANVNLQASGTDLRTLAANLKGIVFVSYGGLTVQSSGFLKRLYGDMLSEIISVINPFSKSDSSVYFDCVVVPLEFDEGQLQTQPHVLIRTDKVRIVSESSIDLRSEKIDMQFRTAPRKGITISAGEILNPYVKLVGTLAAPRLAVDQQGMLISGGAAVATGGLSILAKAAWQRMSRSKDPCTETREQSIEVLGGRFSDLVPLRGNN